MNEARMVAKLFASIERSADFDPEHQIVLLFRELGMPGHGVALVDRKVGETTFITVQTTRAECPPKLFGLMHRTYRDGGRRG